MGFNRRDFLKMFNRFPAAAPVESLGQLQHPEQLFGLLGKTYFPKEHYVMPGMVFDFGEFVVAVDTFSLLCPQPEYANSEIGMVQFSAPSSEFSIVTASMSIQETYELGRLVKVTPANPVPRDIDVWIYGEGTFQRLAVLHSSFVIDLDASRLGNSKAYTTCRCLLDYADYSTTFC